LEDKEKDKDKWKDYEVIDPKSGKKVTEDKQFASIK